MVGRRPRPRSSLSQLLHQGLVVQDLWSRVGLSTGAFPGGFWVRRLPGVLWGVDGAQSLMCMWLVRSGLRDAPAVEQDRTGDHCLDLRGHTPWSYPAISTPQSHPGVSTPRSASRSQHPAVSMQSSDVLRTEEHIQVTDPPERNGNSQAHPHLCAEACGGFIHNYQKFKKTRCPATGG